MCEPGTTWMTWVFCFRFQIAPLNWQHVRSCGLSEMYVWWFFLKSQVSKPSFSERLLGLSLLPFQTEAPSRSPHCAHVTLFQKYEILEFHCTWWKMFKIQLTCQCNLCLQVADESYFWIIKQSTRLRLSRKLRVLCKKHSRGPHLFRVVGVILAAMLWWEHQRIGS